LVFMPYNYLINSKIREKMGVDLKNAIIIIDEGHNISSAA